MHDHATDGGIADYHDKASARDIRLHLDNAHDYMTSGWTHEQLVERHWACHVDGADRLAEIEAAANIIAEGLATAPPAVVESVLGDRSLYLSDANGTVYLAEPAGAYDTPSPESCRCTHEVCFEDECQTCASLDGELPCPRDDDRVGVYYEDEMLPAGAVPLYRLTAQVPPAERVVDLIERTRSSLADAWAYLGAHKESEGAHLSGSPAEVEPRPAGRTTSAGAPSPVVDLMEALEASLAAAKADRGQA